MDSKGGFRVGDRVMYADGGSEFGKYLAGETGTVCRLDGFGSDRVGVEWDKEFDDFHSCNGRCADNHGLYVRYEDLMHEEEANKCFDAVDNSDLTLFLGVSL